MGRLNIAKMFKAPLAHNSVRLDSAEAPHLLEDAHFDFSSAARQHNYGQKAPGTSWHLSKEIAWDRASQASLGDGHPAARECDDPNETPPVSDTTDDEEAGDSTPHSPPANDFSDCLIEFRDAIGDLFRNYCAGDEQVDARAGLFDLIDNLRDCLGDWREGGYSNPWHCQSGDTQPA